MTSPAKGSGSGSADLFYDYYGRQFAPYNGSGYNRCRGAVEYYPLTDISDLETPNGLIIYPNPSSDIVYIKHQRNTEKSVVSVECIEVISGMKFPILFAQFGATTRFDTHSLYQGKYSIVMNGENIGTITVIR